MKKLRNAFQHQESIIKRYRKQKIYLRYKYPTSKLVASQTNPVQIGSMKAILDLGQMCFLTETTVFAI